MQTKDNTCFENGKRKMKPWLMLILLSAATQVAAGESVLLVLGDSLSAGFGMDIRDGWVSLLQRRLEQRGGEWRVVNGSVSGDTSAGGLARLPRLLELHRPALVIIELGSNDGLRGLAFDGIAANLRQMIEAVRQAGAKAVLVGSRLPPNYGVAYTEAFHQLFLEVAASEQVPLVPFLMEGVAQERSLMQADGHHPNAAAQPRLLENVWPVLEPLLNKP
jgi:acyl-CoA thioesterase-1